MYKKIVAILICCVLLISVCFFSKETEQIIISVLEHTKLVDIETIDDFDYIDIEKKGFSEYGKSGLNKKELKYYNLIDEYVYKLQSDIKINNISSTQMRKIFQHYVDDNPQIFWLNYSYKYSYNKINSKIQNIHLSFSNPMLEKWHVDGYSEPIPTYTIEDVEKMSAEIDEVTQEILSGIDINASDYEKVLYVHDYLANTITYNLFSENQHNIYGALVEKKAVCDGISYAMMYLLTLLQVDCKMVYGESLDGETHAWNLVEIDNKYYHVDITWDLPNPSFNYVLYSNFLLSDKSIKKDHVILSPTLSDNGDNGVVYSDEQLKSHIPIPPANEDYPNYYDENNLYIDSFDEENIIKFLGRFGDTIVNLVQKQKDLSYDLDENPKDKEFYFLFKDNNVLNQYMNWLTNPDQKDFLDYRKKFIQISLNCIIFNFNDKMILFELNDYSFDDNIDSNPFI